MKLMISSNLFYGNKMLNREFNDLVWASDNMETVAHYYEGVIVEIEIELKKEVEMEYVSNKLALSKLGVDFSDYTYGHVKTIDFPANANWYCFSRKYLEENLISVKEIFPDLTQLNED